MRNGVAIETEESFCALDSSDSMCASTASDLNTYVAGVAERISPFQSAKLLFDQSTHLLGYSYLDTASRALCKFIRVRSI